MDKRPSEPLGKSFADVPDAVVVTAGDNGYQSDGETQPLLADAPPLLVTPVEAPRRSCASRLLLSLLGAFYLILVLPAFCTFLMLGLGFDNPPRELPPYIALCVVVWSGITIFLSLCIGGIMLLWQALKPGAACQNAVTVGALLPIAHFAFFIGSWVLAVALFGWE